MEYRGLRFHGGVDLRTRKAVGFPVYAIDDGFVSRIKIQHRGFGYALYVDHPNRRIRSVFGHLDDFAEPMASWAAKKLAKLGKRYGIDDEFGPETFPVKKGQLIAYTGETGLGPPHLHFELRTLKDEPLSPTSLGYVIPDRIDPEFTGLWVEPLSFGTRVNGSFLSYRVSLKKHHGNTWTWDEPIRICGRAGLSVGVLDRAEGDNRMSAAELYLSVDDKEFFSRAFHKYSYDENRQAAYVYDAVRSAAPGLGYVVWMFKWPYESMMLSQLQKPWAGVLDSSCVGRRLKIRIRDYSGREACAEGPLDIMPMVQTNKAVLGTFQPKSVEHAFSGLILRGSFEQKVEQADHVQLQMREGMIENLPLIGSGKSAMISVPYDRKWEDGVYQNGARIAGPWVYIDAGPRRINISNSMSLDIPAQAVNLPVLLAAHFSPQPASSRKLMPLSGVWTLAPDWLVVDKPVTLAVDLPSALAEMETTHRSKVASLSIAPRQMGLYGVSGSGEPRHLGGEVQNNRLVYKTRMFGAYTLMADLVPPVVKSAGKRTLKRLGLCRVFEVSDIGEGVDYDRLDATVDGKSVEVDSDPDKSEVYVVIAGKKGKLNVCVKVSDNAGNITTCTVTK